MMVMKMQNKITQKTVFSVDLQTCKL